MSNIADAAKTGRAEDVDLELMPAAMAEFLELQEEGLTEEHLRAFLARYETRIPRRALELRLAVIGHLIDRSLS